MQTQRLSNLELFRIVAMLLIIFSHFFVNMGTLPPHIDFLSFDILKLCCTTGDFGVALFVLISGYFLIQSPFKTKKLYKLVIQAWSIGLILYAFNACFNLIPVTSKLFWNTVLPFRTPNWFFKAYLLLYLTFPLLNKFLLRLNQKRYLLLLTILTATWVIYPATLLYTTWTNGKISLFYWYIIGAYIRLFDIPWLHKTSFKVIFTLGGYALSIILTTILINYQSQHPAFTCNMNAFVTLNSPPVLITSLGIFFIFLDLNIPYNKHINAFAGTMFGVYLIHDSPFLKPLIWQTIVNSPSYYGNYQAPLYAIIWSFVILIACATLEYLRNKVLEWPSTIFYDTFLSNIGNKINQKYNNINL